MKAIIVPNKFQQAKIKSIVIGALIFLSSALGLILTTYGHISPKKTFVFFVVPYLLLLFLRRHAQWEIALIDDHIIEMYFRLGPWKFSRQSFSAIARKDAVVEQDSKRYFNLYLVTDSARIKIGREATRAQLDNAEEELRTAFRIRAATSSRAK